MANLNGTEAADTIIGTPDDDVINGLGGDDEIRAGDGADRLLGGAGRDILDGGRGSDFVDYRTAEAAVVVNLGDQAVTVGGVTIASGQVWDGGQDEGGATLDTIISVGLVAGSSHDDLLIGNTNFNVIEGDAGDDDIRAGDGDDILIGGAGRDILNGGAGSDRVDYSTAGASVVVNLGDTTVNVNGVDIASGQAWDGGQDANGATLDSISSIGLMSGSNFGDLLIGNTNYNAIEGNDGDDRIDGGAGGDDLEGGAGGDTFVLRAGATDGTVLLDFNAAEGDTIEFLDFPEDARLEQVGAESWRVVHSGGVEAVTIFGTVPEGSYAFLSSEPEEPNFGDTFVGTDDDDTIDGTDGDDTVAGMGGADNLYGHGGNDHITGDGGTDELHGGDGNDILEGGFDASWDHLYGEAGDDILDGGADGDILDGGSGADTYIFRMGEAAGDELHGFNGAEGDRIEFHGFPADARFAEIPDNYWQILYDNDTKIEEIFVLGTISEGDYAFVNSTEPEEPQPGGNQEITGTDGNDDLEGTSGDDVLFGRAGDDALDGRAGADIVVGDGGADTFIFRAGEADGDEIIDFNAAEGDRIEFRGFASDATFRPLADDVWRITHNNYSEWEEIRISGEVFRGDFSFVESTNITAEPTEPPPGQTITGTEVDDTLFGDVQDDTLSGLGGNDKIYGGSGGDSMDGGAGDDILDGGTASDKYTGGDGADTFWLWASEADGDRLLDFNAAQGDVIEFHGYAEDAVLVKEAEDGLWSVDHANGYETIRISGDVTEGSYRFVDSVEIPDPAPSEPGGNRISGTSGTDTLNGTEEADKILAWGGHDTIDGRGGTDWIEARNGNDMVDGGAGADSLLGGGGSDTFVFQAGEADGDWIHDFESGADSLLFEGYGSGATFRSIGNDRWQVANSDGSTIETITINGAVQQTDYLFA